MYLGNIFQLIYSEYLEVNEVSLPQTCKVGKYYYSVRICLYSAGSIGHNFEKPWTASFSWLILTVFSAIIGHKTFIILWYSNGTGIHLGCLHWSAMEKLCMNKVKGHKLIPTIPLNCILPSSKFGVEETKRLTVHGGWGVG